MKNSILKYLVEQTIISELNQLLEQEKGTFTGKPNKGDISEGLLACAVIAKFLNPYNEIEAKDIIAIVRQLDKNKNISPQNRQVIQKRKNFKRPPNPKIPGAKMDQAYLQVALAPYSWAGFTDINFISSEMSSIIQTIAKFVNSARIADVAIQTYENRVSNFLEALAVGTENQKGTKIDVRVLLDGKPSNLLSLKTSSDLLGQVGSKWMGDQNTRGIFDLFSSLFDIKLDSTVFENAYLKAVATKDPKKIKAVATKIYSAAQKLIEQKFDEDLYGFLRTMARGIRWEATLGEEGVILIQLGKNDFKEISFDKLLEWVDDLERDGREVGVGVEFTPRGEFPVLMINLEIDGEPVGRLVQIRLKVESNGKVRHYVEKGPALARLIAIN